MLTKALLTAAKAKITDPKHWTKGTFFRDAYGHDTVGLTPATTCMCAAGALAAAMVDANPALPAACILETPEFSRAWTELNQLVPKATDGRQWVVQGINDQEGHDATLRFYDYAIEVTNP